MSIKQIIFPPLLLYEHRIFMTEPKLLMEEGKFFLLLKEMLRNTTVKNISFFLRKAESVYYHSRSVCLQFNNIRAA